VASARPGKHVVLLHSPVLPRPPPLFFERETERERERDTNGDERSWKRRDAPFPRISLLSRGDKRGSLAIGAQTNIRITRCSTLPPSTPSLSLSLSLWLSVLRMDPRTRNYTLQIDTLSYCGLAGKAAGSAFIPLVVSAGIRCSR
jgi:hypothetical protein